MNDADQVQSPSRKRTANEILQPDAAGAVVWGGCVPSDTAAPAPTPDEPLAAVAGDGPDPTRYGDWEKKGRCVDF